MLDACLLMLKEFEYALKVLHGGHVVRVVVIIPVVGACFDLLRYKGGIFGHSALNLHQLGQEAVKIVLRKIFSIHLEPLFDVVKTPLGVRVEDEPFRCNDAPEIAEKGETGSCRERMLEDAMILLRRISSMISVEPKTEEE
jgi:hypothetical protein